MNRLEIIGYKRANLGKAASKAIRENGDVPCVIYGGAEQIACSIPAILFRDLVYTPNANLVDLNVEGTIYPCILQDIQFHPVNDMILHADFLLLHDDKEVKMEIPVKLEGTAVGVTKGGKIIPKLRKLKVRALPKDLPDYIVLDVTALDLGKTIKVSAIKPENYTILNSASVPVVSIEIPRALRGAGKTGK